MERSNAKAALGSSNRRESSLGEGHPCSAGDSCSEGYSGWEVRDKVFLGALVVAFVVSRIAWILWNPESASYWEESYRWFAAHELLTGPTLPLLEYQADHYQGGSLFVILLTLPFFAVAGESLLTLKLAAIALSVATMVTLFYLNLRFFGRAASRLACLAYLAGPPLVAFWGVTLMGFHADSALLSLLQVCAYLGLLTGAWRNATGWAAFGLACGAGLSFTYITALSAAACLLSWLLMKPVPGRRELLFAVGGLVVGLLPWLAYNGSHGFAGIDRILEVFGGSAAAVDPWRAQSLLERIADLMVTMPTLGLLDPANATLPPALRPFVFAGFLVPTASALVAGILRTVVLARQRLRKGSAAGDDLVSREVVFFVYAALFAGAYLGSRFTLVTAHPIDYRLFPPLAVLLMTPVAVTAARMLSRGGLIRHLAVFAAVTCLASSALATLAFAARSPASGSVSLADGYKVHGRLLHRKHSELRRALNVTAYGDPDLQEMVLWGIGWEIEHRFEVAGEFKDVVASIREIPTVERGFVVEGIRWTGKRRLLSLEEGAQRSEEDRTTLKRVRALLRFAEAEQARLRAASKKREASSR